MALLREIGFEIDNYVGVKAPDSAVDVGQYLDGKGDDLVVGHCFDPFGDRAGVEANDDRLASHTCPVVPFDEEARFVTDVANEVDVFVPEDLVELENHAVEHAHAEPADSGKFVAREFGFERDYTGFEYAERR